MTDSLLARAKLITGCTEAELAEVVGIGVPTASAYIGGRRREYLNQAQIDTLAAFLETYATSVRKAVDEFVLFA